MKKILLIEDNQQVRENTAEILELAYYEVETAENGKIGVEKAKSTAPDLIICDIMMPELDGYGVLHILSKDDHTRQIPFIFLTAKAERSDFRKGMNLGADDYLTKPFDDSELLDSIESRLKKADLFKQEYQQNIKGLDQFMNAARGLKGLSELSASRRTRIYKKKINIYLEGDFPNHLLFINYGKVKNFKSNKDGKELITSIAVKGDFLGYQDLIMETEFTESAAALEETEICFIPKDDFFTLLYSNRDVASKFIKMLSNNLQEKEEKLLNLAYNSVRQRVAEALLELEKRNVGSGESFSVSREDLANMVGTAQESVIRTLSDFKNEGSIGISSGKISIADSSKLTQVINYNR
jgi:CheY-like chemotaxis protein